MATDHKQAYIANFNCTFGKKNEPMLTHFFDVILPAFSSETDVRKKFFFENVKLLSIRGDFVLAGLIVKRTTLEVKSRIIQGKLTKTNEIYPSDPYSYFLINLQNHRMVLVKNQKGSPTLSNFSKTAFENINKYIKNNDVVIDENADENDFGFELNIVAIPFTGKIKEELAKVKKVNTVTLRFYPLNGDIIDNETAEDLLNSLDKIESKSGNLNYNSPKNKDAVVEVVDGTKGLMKPSIKVEYADGSKGNLNDKSFTEVMNLSVEESDSFEANIDTILGKVINKPQFNELSDENKSIYNRLYTKLENFYKKFK
ncbi:hypothetical protein [Lysinibacillus agricola]|uniref:hypothetical protein n=1 Tax=Lysinibacillus agricola TaxID=2590012 RepID=UPI003C19F9F3